MRDWEWLKWKEKYFVSRWKRFEQNCNNQQNSTRHEPTSKSCFWAAKSSKVSSIQKSINYSDTHFQLNQTPPLEVLSLRSRIFQKLSVFSVKFTRIQSWNSSIHTELALAKSFSLPFYYANFDWCMCCQMPDLIGYMETLSSRACIEKMDISQAINKQHLPSSAILLEKYA